MSQSSRRVFLSQAYNGIGALALGGVMAHEARASTIQRTAKPPHFQRKAKNCIFLFMQGGVSQMDSFDYKPVLNTLHGKPLPRLPSISGELQGRLSFHHSVIGSAFKFQQHGESSRYMSELFPYLAEHVDDMAFIHGIKTDNQNHGPSCTT